MPVSKSESLDIRSDDDVVRVRQAVRKWAIELGFSLVDQTKMITAASELARNTLDHGGGGIVRLEALQESGRQGAAAHLRGPGAGHPRHRRWPSPTATRPATGWAWA